MKIGEMLKPLRDQLDKFMYEFKEIEHIPDDPDNINCIFFMYGDTYILVEPERSYWYKEDDGTVVYRINEVDLDEL